MSSGVPVRLERAPRQRNFDEVADLVAQKVKKSAGKISAKRLLPLARAAGYEGSARNFRRLVAEAKATWRQGQHGNGRGRRPAVWTPGETLVIDWGVQGGLHVFCAVLAWSRFRFVRFAEDEKADTTLGLLAECFEVLGGVPKVVLADRMGCLKGGVVANVVVPTPDYVRFAMHYRFRPDFCEASDPESKGIVENLVGYAKDDLMVPLELTDDPWKGPGSDLALTWPGSTPPPRSGAPRSTPRSIRRSARSPTSDWRPNGSSWARCRRCDPRSARSPPPGRSTRCRASGSPRPATRCLTD